MKFVETALKTKLRGVMHKTKDSINITDIWIMFAEHLNVTYITFSNVVKFSGLTQIFVLNMRLFVLNYLFCPNVAFFLCKCSRDSRAKVI